MTSSPRSSGNTLATLLMLLAVPAVLPGCEGETEQPATEVTTPIPPPTVESTWNTNQGSALVAIETAEDDDQLNEAMGQARRTAGQARDRWEHTDPAHRDAWAIKWRAPLEEGGFEHVWVIPARWTEHRIEGSLASPPYYPLLCGKSEGEFVSFAADQLSDWVHLLEGRIDGPRDGGYTMDVLRERHGEPRGGARE